jgi:anthranilate synthase component II
MKILLLDNYDSFTYNLLHLIKAVSTATVDVFRNDAINMEAIKQYDKIILSPGPGVPSEAGMLLPIIKEYSATKSILGVCLGHQAIGEAFGGTLINLTQVFHGVATDGIIEQANAILLQGLANRFIIGRYHSWVIAKDAFPETLEITAYDDNGFIMALQHKSLDIHGVQFHPESVLTPDGAVIMKNFLR